MPAPPSVLDSSLAGAIGACPAGIQTHTCLCQPQPEAADPSILDPSAGTHLNSHRQCPGCRPPPPPLSMPAPHPTGPPAASILASSGCRVASQPARIRFWRRPRRLCMRVCGCGCECGGVAVEPSNIWGRQDSPGWCAGECYPVSHRTYYHWHFPRAHAAVCISARASPPNWTLKKNRR